MNLIIFLLIILLDQIIKKIVLNNIAYGSSIGTIVKIANVSNTGIAYGYGKDNQLFIIILNVVIIGVLISFLVKNYKQLTNMVKLSIVIILAGGISNLIDRIFRGYVVDYIDINTIIKYPVFNIADMAIVIGGILIVEYIIIKTIKKQEKA